MTTGSVNNIAIIHVGCQLRDETKYSRLPAFGVALSRLRQHIERHLHLPGLSREKVLATVVRLLDLTLIYLETVPIRDHLRKISDVEIAWHIACKNCFQEETK